MAAMIIINMIAQSVLMVRAGMAACQAGNGRLSSGLMEDDDRLMEDLVRENNGDSLSGLTL